MIGCEAVDEIHTRAPAKYRERLLNRDVVSSGFRCDGTDVGLCMDMRRIAENDTGYPAKYREKVPG